MKLMRILMDFIIYILISGQHYKDRRFKIEIELSRTNNKSDIQWKGAQEKNYLNGNFKNNLYLELRTFIMTINSFIKVMLQNR